MIKNCGGEILKIARITVLLMSQRHRTLKHFVANGLSNFGCEINNLVRKLQLMSPLHPRRRRPRHRVHAAIYDMTQRQGEYILIYLPGFSIAQPRPPPRLGYMLATSSKHVGNMLATFSFCFFENFLQRTHLARKSRLPTLLLNNIYRLANTATTLSAKRPF